MSDDKVGCAGGYVCLRVPGFPGDANAIDCAGGQTVSSQVCTGTGFGVRSVRMCVCLYVCYIISVVSLRWFLARQRFCRSDLATVRVRVLFPHQANIDFPHRESTTTRHERCSCVPCVFESLHFKDIM